MKLILAGLGLWLTLSSLLTAAETNPATLATSQPGDNVPAPGPRDRAYGISGPGAKHTAAWTNYNLKCTGAAVKAGLIPNLKPLIPDTQLRDTVVILGGGGSITKMKRDLSGFDGEAHRIAYEKPADGSWTRSSIGQEGATMFKRGGIYYLGGAAFYKPPGSDSLRYSSAMALSTNLFGPYTKWHEAVPCGGGTDYFQDKEGNWWCAFFGNDNPAPFREKPAIVKIDFAADGKIVVAKDQPDFVLQKQISK